MHNRIAELEKQCWSHRVEGALVDGQLHFDTARFAELIVKECMSNLYLNGYDNAMMQIKQHFGVE